MKSMISTFIIPFILCGQSDKNPLTVLTYHGSQSDATDPKQSCREGLSPL